MRTRRRLALGRLRLIQSRQAAASRPPRARGPRAPSRVPCGADALHLAPRRSHPITCTAGRLRTGHAARASDRCPDKPWQRDNPLCPGADFFPFSVNARVNSRAVGFRQTLRACGFARLGPGAARRLAGA
jgi:hypothetical protein